MDRLKAGDIVSHFKRDAWLERYNNVEEDLRHSACFNDHTYLYQIMDTNVTHTETKERLVVYRALYSNDDMHVSYNQVFARPYDMFMSEVDCVKYHNAKQKYRFEVENDYKY